MINYLIANWDSVLLVVAFILFIIVLLQKGYRKQVNDILFYLVTKAERDFGKGTGELKYANVTTCVYSRLPLIARFVFTPKQLDRMIENAVTRLKEYLLLNEHVNKLIK